MAKYSTLKELAAAFKSGELDSSFRLVIDKGGCSLHLRQDGPAASDYQRSLRCRELFEWEFGDPLVELFKLAEIPAEWC